MKILLIVETDDSTFDEGDDGTPPWAATLLRCAADQIVKDGRLSGGAQLRFGGEPIGSVEWESNDATDNPPF